MSYSASWPHDRAGTVRATKAYASSTLDLEQDSNDTGVPHVRCAP